MMAWRRTAPWLLAWIVLVFAGSAWLAHDRLQALRDTFDTNARIAHRLLSQRMAQHDAILGALVLLQPAPDGATPPWNGLPRLYPQILAVARNAPTAHAAGEARWPAGWPASLEIALQRSRTSNQAALAPTDLTEGRLWLVQAGQPASYALQLDLHATIFADDWPLPPQGPVRAWLQWNGARYLIQRGDPAIDHAAWTWRTHKTLASHSQPLDLYVEERVSPAMLPWATMAAWAVLCALGLLALRTLLGQRSARRRAERLLQLDQVARLNTLGELAAGMAHELNQPLTAIVASSQAAQRLLADDPPELNAARGAITQAAAQAKRAADVIKRLRRLLERPDAHAKLASLDLPAAVAEALRLLEPELQKHGVRVQQRVAPHLPLALADAIAVQQILHNLLQNACHALQACATGERQIAIELAQRGPLLLVAVQDDGPGVAPELRPRLFTPFASNRAGGLGLGLVLSQSLAESMGARLQLADSSRGARFELLLPAATSSGAAALEQASTPA